MMRTIPPFSRPPEPAPYLKWSTLPWEPASETLEFRISKICSKSTLVTIRSKHSRVTGSLGASVCLIVPVFDLILYIQYLNMLANPARRANQDWILVRYDRANVKAFVEVFMFLQILLLVLIIFIKSRCKIKTWSTTTKTVSPLLMLIIPQIKYICCL